jgi:hypothetical protein
MKRLLVIFLLLIQIPITCSSQVISNQTDQDSTVLLTTSQLKYANLIFAEHNKLLNENSLLKEQITNYNKVVADLEQIDSLKTVQLNLQAIAYSEQINKLNAQLKKNKISRNAWMIGGISVSVGLLLYGLLK